jgi:hypothetical protein
MERLFWPLGRILLLIGLVPCTIGLVARSGVNARPKGGLR